MACVAIHFVWGSDTDKVAREAVSVIVGRLCRRTEHSEDFKSIGSFCVQKHIGFVTDRVLNTD